MNTDFEKLVEDLRNRNEVNANRYQSLTDQEIIIKALDAVQYSVVKSIAVLSQTLTENPPTSGDGKTVVHKTDMRPVVKRLQAVERALAKLPTKHPEMPEMPREMAVKGLEGVHRSIKDLNTAILKIKPEVKLDTKNQPTKADIKSLEKAIKGIKIPGNADVAKEVRKVVETIDGLQFPTPNVRSTYVNSDGEHASPVLTEDGKVPVDASVSVTGGATEDKQDDQITVLNKILGFDIPPYDEIELSYTGDDLTGVVYKKDTATVGTLTLTYTTGNLTNVSLS